MPTKPISIKPSRGGRLMSVVSSADAGVFNYTMKRDWRRDFDGEARAEGFDLFYPKTTEARGNQPFPNPEGDEPITVLCEIQRANGQRAVIAGTKTTLYRFYAYEHGIYVEDGYVADDYFAEIEGEWITIGSGFSEDGRRWEVEQVGQYLVFNNSVDMPVTYRFDEYEVKPIYELRDQGVARVETIATINGVLLCGGITEIKEAAKAGYFDLLGPVGATQLPTGYGLLGTSVRVGDEVDPSLPGDKMVSTTSIFSGGEAGRIVVFANGLKATIAEVLSGTVATLTFAGSITEDLIEEPISVYTYVEDESSNNLEAVSDIFTPEMVGGTVLLSDGGSRRIAQYIDPQNVKVDRVGIFGGFIRVANPAAYGLIDEADLQTIPYRVLWSQIDNPRQFAAAITGSMTAGDNIFHADRPINWITAGDSMIVLGAGVSGGNLSSAVVAVLDGGMTIVLATAASTTVTAALAQNLAQVGGIVGYDDLQDDGSAIVKMVPIRDTLVVYKESMIFVGAYTGQAGAAFSFKKVCETDNTPAYRNAVAVLDRYHVYPAANGFFRFDLVTLFPVEFEPLTMCQDLFYRNVLLLAPEDEDAVFAADNAVTNEIFFCFPSSEADKCIRFDYRFGTAATSSAEYTAGAMVERPREALTSHKEQWFILGTSDGKVLRYGRVDKPEVSGSGTQSGTTVTAGTAGTFKPEHVGRTIVWADGTHLAITGYTSGTVVTVSASKAVASATAFKILPAIWNRAGENYDSVLQSGMEGFNSDGEKRLVSWTPILSSKSRDCALLAKWYGCHNVAQDPALLGSKTIASPRTQPLVPTFFQRTYLQDQITVSGKDNPVVLAERIWRINGVNSQSFARRET